jgi:serine/threonine-protein kinase
MALTAGARFGAYEITSALGAGGMGEVYRARDTKLGRDVAIKVLLESVAGDRDRLVRFHREAQVLATLNHPNIAAIYGLEERVEGSADASTALVMELVDGPTLADRIAHGPIPIDEALPIARQIAEALEAAHELGIIHRDLKPANIKLRPDGTVKVLDFGLAKFAADGPGASGGSGGAAHSPTMSIAATRAGVILGTAAYMAPEQARGRAVDKRADVWAFGVVLYEMLTGRAAFAGDDISDILASVLKFEPEWSHLPVDTPPAIRRLLKRSLAKDPKLRLRECGSAIVDIQEALTHQPPESAPPLAAASTPRLPVLLLMAASALIIAVTAAATWALSSARATPKPELVRRLTITLPESDEMVPNTGRLITISPDGRTLVYRARRGEGRPQLFRRSIDQFEATALPGSEGYSSGPISPDGAWLGTVSDRSVKKLLLAGGGAGQTLFEFPNAGAPRGFSWSSSDHILWAYATRSGSTLMRIPANGGEATEVFKTKGDVIAILPESVPGANAILYTHFKTTLSGMNPNVETGEVHVLKLDTAEDKLVVPNASAGRVLSTGHLVFTRASTLWAVPFDSIRLEAVGTPVPVLEGIRAEGATQFDISNEGTLAYVAGTAEAERSLAFVRRDGTIDRLAAPERQYLDVALSPDQTRVATQIGINDDADVWVVEVARGTLTRVTSEPGFEGNMLWSPDGASVVYASNRGERWTVSRKAADGTGQPEQLAVIDKATRVRPRTWTADGSTLLVEVDDDIGGINVKEKGEWKPLIQTSAQEREPAISPDGRWIAYATNDAKTTEIYLQSFPRLGERRPVSIGGGSYPTWSRDGRHIFYPLGGPPTKVMRVSVETGRDGRVTIGKPESFVDWNFYSRAGSYRIYDVAADGQSLLVILRSSDTAWTRQINVVTNWFEELRRLVPVK